MHAAVVERNADNPRARQLGPDALDVVMARDYQREAADCRVFVFVFWTDGVRERNKRRLVRS